MSAIWELSDRAVDEVAASNPVLATRIGVAGFDEVWTDYSPDGHAERSALAARLATAAEECAVSTRWERLARRVLLDHCAEQVAFTAEGDHLVDLNSIASPLQSIRAIFDLMATDDQEGWANVAARLESISQPLAGYRASLEAGRANGHTVARRQAEEAVRQCNMASGEQSSLRKLDFSGVESQPLRRRLAAAVDGACRTYGEFGDYVAQRYLPETGASDGVGAERYRRAARRHLGAEVDLEETYRWGWDEVERLRGEFEEVCGQIDPEAGIFETVERLQTDPTLAATSLDEFIQLMKDRQDQALTDLDGVHFDVPSAIRRIDVRVEPAGGSLAPNYSRPSEDLSRPGTVWYPVEGQDFFPLYQEITTAYHEGFPGHHLQVGWQVVNGEHISRFHRMVVWYPGSGEGWALYAEHLMDELGYLERPEYRAGYITAQLLRASRIAIDIGSHVGLPIPDDVSFHPGEDWTFDLAMEMLTDVALLPQEMAQSEVTRYLGWPGQAIGYKVGERMIRDLRTDAQRRRGFDRKAFHGQLLDYGAVGLDLLAELVGNN